ncbi:hypothetical protein MRBLMC3_002878 [Sphingobium sp. LMC3-1-1.1]|uniref:hypothetical protein n=1 Tax=Sphingobium sp. LMC3-1-1.1 TaxID=3135241 RepID=UPI003422F74B
MSRYLNSDPIAPATLQRAAQDERARRAQASRAAVEAGKVSKEKADQDDALWSNIVHYFRRWSGDRREPRDWSKAERETMARNARATLQRMLVVLAGSTRPEDLAKLKALMHIAWALEYPLLYTMIHPLPDGREKALAA